GAGHEAALIAESFEWIWEGLPPTERLVMAAMAEAEERVIAYDQLVEALQRSGVALMLDQLQLAPQRLVEWHFLRPTKEGYSFCVPLWQEWVRLNRPLYPVKEELERLNARPEAYFESAQRFYESNQIDLAANHLRQTLRFDPAHLKARLLLAQILRESGDVTEAVDLLEDEYEYHPQAVRADLVQTLLLYADTQDEAGQLATYERVLELEPNQPVATARRRALFDVEEKRELAAQYESEDQWEAAIAIYQTLLAKYPEQEEWPTRLKQAQIRANLAQRYKKGLKNLKTGRASSAQRLLANVIAEEPNYKDAARHLLLATTGVDVVELQQENQQLHATLNNLHAKVQELEEQKSAPKSLPLLSAWNPLDYLRLLWWLFVTPQQVTHYQAQYGSEGLTRHGKWLSSTLIWWPLFLPTLALGLGQWSAFENPDPFVLNSYCVLSGGVLLAWVLMGWQSKPKEHQGDSMSLAESLSLVIALLVAGGIAGKIGLVMALIVALMMGLVVVRVIKGPVVLIMAATIALIGALAVALLVATDITSRLALVAGFLVSLLIATLTTRKMHKSVESGQPSCLPPVALVGLLLANAFIAWYAFFAT
ncbi:MAG: tetratricopeptide repeat protein, partial [Ardenticatenaceae bacterium]